MHDTPMKAGIIVMILAVVTVIHHLPMRGVLGTHILHRELFFFPIVLAGLWFGLKAAMASAVAASVFYAHLFIGNADLQSASVVAVGLQVAGFNLMALLTGWMVDHRRRQRREQDALNETFGRYVSNEVRDEILGGRVSLKGELKEVTILFADLRDFTGLVETIPPRDVVTIVNTYFEVMSEAITAHQGLVVQFIGDEIEAVFGAPLALDRHQQHAVDAALEMRTSLSRVNLRLARQGFPPLKHGVGIHTGNVVAANIGSHRRLSYALVGETVNIASRIQGLNKHYATDILISDAVRKGIDRCADLSPLPPAEVKGVREPLCIFSIDKPTLQSQDRAGSRRCDQLPQADGGIDQTGTRGWECLPVTCFEAGVPKSKQPTP